MVRVAQLVRAPDCGSGGRGFDSRLSPLLVNMGDRCHARRHDRGDERNGISTVAGNPENEEGETK